MKRFLMVTFVTLLWRNALCCKGKDAQMQRFQEFITKFNKTYKGQEEFQKRFGIFVDNLKEIERLNKKSKGLTEYAINPFSDLSWKEFKKNRLLEHPPSILNSADVFTASSMRTAAKLRPPPSHIDMRHFPIPPIKDQGQCGSCSTFAAIAVVEIQNWLKTSYAYSLSEQQLLDCTNMTCETGAYVHSNFEYIRQNGIVRDHNYPYTGVKGAIISKWSWLRLTEEEMMEYIARVGPIAVTMKVGPSFHSVTKGIITDTDCEPDGTVGWHAVTVVGYGEENGQPYWLSRNSWGTWFGDDGYFRSARGSNWCGWTNYMFGVTI